MVNEGQGSVVTMVKISGDKGHNDHNVQELMVTIVGGKLLQCCQNGWWSQSLKVNCQCEVRVRNDNDHGAQGSKVCGYIDYLSGLCQLVSRHVTSRHVTSSYLCPFRSSPTHVLTCQWMSSTSQ